jgi:ubiquinone/menaquinone biosynthesis C-methylase UbiE
MENSIESNFPSGDFSFLDVGGGNGTFADRLLETYQKAQGTVIDNVKYLLHQNFYHKRKSWSNAQLKKCSINLSFSYLL